MHQLAAAGESAGRQKWPNSSGSTKSNAAAGPDARAPAREARGSARCRSLGWPTDASGKALRPWIDVALPHPDVIANRFKEAEFAADLFAVDAGLASEGYATPMSFFGITFLTEGLKRVLSRPCSGLRAPAAIR